MKSYLDMPQAGEQYFGPDGKVYVRGQEPFSTVWLQDLVQGRPQPPETYVNHGYNAAAYNAMAQSAKPAAAAPAPAPATPPVVGPSTGTVMNWAGVPTPVAPVNLNYTGNQVNQGAQGFQTGGIQKLIDAGKYNEAAVQLNLERDRLTSPYFEQTLKDQAEAAQGLKQLAVDYGQGDPIIQMPGIDPSVYAPTQNRGYEQYRQVKAQEVPVPMAQKYGELIQPGALVGMDEGRIAQAGQSAEDAFLNASRQYARSRAGAPESGLGSGLFFLGKQARSRAEADMANRVDDLRVQQQLADREALYQQGLGARQYDLAQADRASQLGYEQAMGNEAFRRAQQQRTEDVGMAGEQAERDRLARADEEARQRRIADAIAGRDTAFQQALGQREGAFQRKRGLFQSIMGQQANDGSGALTASLSGAANAAADRASNLFQQNMAQAEADRQRKKDRYNLYGGILSAFEKDE